MSILTTCTNCKKRYKVADEMAGRKVKCKACGETFRIPTPAPKPPIASVPPAPPTADELPDLDALAAMESYSTSVNSAYAGPSSPQLFARPANTRPIAQFHAAPVSGFYQRTLPIILLLVGSALPTLLLLIGVYQFGPAIMPTLPAPLGGAILSIIFVIGVAIVFKVLEFATEFGARWGAQLLELKLPEPARPRVMGAFALCPLFMCGLAYFSYSQNPFRSTLPAMVIGLVLGIVVAGGLMILLFRAPIATSLVSATIGGTGYFLGITAIRLLLIFAVYVLQGNLTKSQGQLAQEKYLRDLNEQGMNSLAKMYDASKQKYADEHHISPSDVTPEMLAEDNQAKAQLAFAETEFMTALSGSLQRYFGTHGSFPPTSDALVQSGLVSSNQLKSPYDTTGGGPDYAYFYHPEIQLRPSVPSLNKITTPATIHLTDNMAEKRSFSHNFSYELCGQRLNKMWPV